MCLSGIISLVASNEDIINNEIDNTQVVQLLDAKLAGKDGVSIPVVDSKGTIRILLLGTLLSTDEGPVSDSKSSSSGSTVISYTPGKNYIILLCDP